MEDSSKADLAALVRKLEGNLDIDHGDAQTRSWNHLIDQCEEIEALAYDIGVTRATPKAIWNPRSVEIRNGVYDYITPYKKIEKAIRTRLDKIKKKLPAARKPTTRESKWGRLRKLILKHKPETYEEKRKVLQLYKQGGGKATMQHVSEQIRYLRRRSKSARA